VKPECIDSTVPTKVEPVTPERIDSMTYLSVSIKEIPDEEMTVPEETAPVFDTKEDIWGNYKPMVTDISTYQLQDEDVLIEYSEDRMEMCLIENVSLNSPLTKDGTSKNEMKFSNKAQQFAITGAHSKVEHKKKSFEELVPSYLHDFCDIFAKDGLNRLPPERPGIDHCIEMKPGFILKTSKIYPLSEKERSAVKAFIDENKKTGFISESKSPQASGFFFVGKKSGELHPCQDYWYINDWMIKNSYPLPLPLTLIARLHDAKYFTKMDVRSGYNNIRIHPDDRWKAAFTTEFGLFEPNVMFFGLCNSPAMFQAYMNRTFQQEINEGWLVIYMDDILIFSKTLNEHQKQTRRILEIIRQEQLFLKPEKCTFDAEEVEYLGMIIKPGHVTMDPAKLDGIKDWPVPTMVKETQSFLGFCNFYQNFISHYSDLARPLIDLTKKDVQFLWTEACNDSFLALKDCFLRQPVLRNPDPTRQFAVATDASLVATRAVLLQTDDNGQYHPCSYLSQSLNPAEQNYQIFDRELLAVIRALTEWHHYLEGNPHPVMVFTDHKNLLYFHTAQKLTRRQARWQLILSMFDIELHHVPGTKLAAPDVLSRRPDHLPTDSDNADVTLLPDTMFVCLLDESLCDALSTDDPSTDPIFSTASDALTGLCLPPMKSALSDWKIVDGILYYKDRAYVAPATRHDLLRCLHDHPTVGHPSHFKTEELVKCDFWWPGLGAYV
jgi:hypothetical protein